jgi:hypothetical protein
MDTDDAKREVLARTEFDRLVPRVTVDSSMSGKGEFSFFSFFFRWFWATKSA